MQEQLLERDWLLPSPAVTLSRVRHEDIGVTIVRDDLLHPWAGGNKLRKLDAWIPELQARNVDAVVTCGGVQSAHCAAVAVLCAERGLRPHVFLRGEPLERPTGYNLISHLFADVTYVDRDRYADRSFLDEEVHNLEQLSMRVAKIPEGGGGELALLGLIRLVKGLTLRLEDPWSTRYELLVDAGTGTTAAGLALGVSLLELPWKVQAVMLMRDSMSDYQKHTSALWDAWSRDHSPPARAPEIVWNARARPRRFGDTKPGEFEKCAEIARNTGVLFDPVYTLASWEAVELLSQRDRKKTVLLHTGGTLNMFSVRDRMGISFGSSGH